jgi:hypothetical protein
MGWIVKRGKLLLNGLDKMGVLVLLASSDPFSSSITDHICDYLSTVSISQTMDVG